jgi:nitroreductase
MSLLGTAHGHASVRTYDPQEVDRPTLLSLMAAAAGAPKVAQAPLWQYVVIQDRALLRSLSDRAKARLAGRAGPMGLTPECLAPFVQPDFNIFYDASTLVVICAKNKGRLALAECWLAEENLMLAAHARGLGTCAIGLAVAVLNTPEAKHELGIAPELTPVAPIVVGKPRRETAHRVSHPMQSLAVVPWTIRRNSVLPWTRPERRANAASPRSYRA